MSKPELKLKDAVKPLNAMFWVRVEESNLGSPALDQALGDIQAWLSLAMKAQTRAKNRAATADGKVT